jgi:hypothetical protein
MPRVRARDLRWFSNSSAMRDGIELFHGDSGFLGSETCVDTTMPPPYNIDHDFEVIKKVVLEPVRLTGHNTPNRGYSGDVDANGYSPFQLWSPLFLPNPDQTDWNYWKTKALANLNPTRARTNVPLFIFEFKDFPGMLHGLGNVLNKNISASSIPHGYLASHFGWKPLASDVASLFDIANMINGQMNFLSRLDRGSRFRRTLFKGHVYTERAPVFDGFTFDGWRYLAERQFTRDDKVWFTAKAKLVTPLPNGTDVRSLSARQALGLTTNPAAIWDFIPWTWLIDYFGNVGDFMQANVGLCQVSVRDMNIMHTQSIECIHMGARSEVGFSFNPYHGQTVAKRRAVFGLPIPFLGTRPFLGTGQKLALGSLITAAAIKAASGR